MTLDLARARRYLKAFDMENLFIEELGWDHYAGGLDVEIDGERFTLQAVAEKRGVVALSLAGELPPHATRRKIDRKVAQSFREHIIIYVNPDRTEQIWQWVRREPGKPLSSREHRYHIRQPGDSLIQKLQAIAFDLAEEETLTLVDVTGRVRAAFNVEQATRRFYDRFKKERDAFEKFLQGIPDEEMERWYVSVMLNRLMFIYFIQKKGFLDNDPDYLRTRLALSQVQGADRYYADFLCPLFFEGFARPLHERSPAMRALLGEVPFLNGGIFQRHEVEQLHGRTIRIPDAAFERLFDFFDSYQWHLDDRPLRADNEINPDVLGYIFEKYINQKQMGAYYTKEDITDYISKNTIIPFLFDDARKQDPSAFRGPSSVWTLLTADPDRYIYDAMREGVDLALPKEIAAGIEDESQRDLWNTPTPDEYALPTEIWRETMQRRQRYEEVWLKLVEGEVQEINDLITYNLDIQQFAQDAIENCETPELLRAFWKAINGVSVLDPTCGSGAFLFAALNILDPLYEACLARMEAFLVELEDDAHPHKYRDFRAVLEQVAQHPSRPYYVLKSIVINNLYGVDIMAEAVEIAKLRLFLKLVAQVERVEKIEPLPDIDFNIRAGNSLVGFATREQVQTALRNQQVSAGVQQGRLMFEEDHARLRLIEERAEDVDRLYQHFRQQQTELGGEVTAEDKQALRGRLDALSDELDRYLAQEYGVDVDKPLDYERWRKSHQPFHWFVEFYGILRHGGFDAVIGNPPYVEYRLVRDDYRLQPGYYRSEPTSNLYAFCMERSCHLLNERSRFGMIVPMGLLGLDKALALRKVLLEKFSPNHCSTYGIRPSKLFDGVDQRLCIYLGKRASQIQPAIWTTQHRFWNGEERGSLFPTLVYQESFLHDRLERIPQLGSALSIAILNKLERHSRRTILSYYSLAREDGGLMHYHRSPRYWIRAMDFEQYFRSPTRSRSVHHFRDLYFRSQIEAKAIGAMLNSTLFYSWFISLGNGRNITGTDVERFPVGEVSGVLTGALPNIFDRLMADYKENSFVRHRSDCEYQEFRPSLSKQIIDEIDQALAQHYGFTDEELDFIINYDIKYRMGDELFEEDEDPEDEE